MARRAVAENVVKLTPGAVNGFTLEAGHNERVIWDSVVLGLGCRLRGAGKTWVIRPPRLGGRSSLHSLGPVAALSLADARKLADERLRAARLGDDPGAARRAARKAAAVTLGNTFERYTAWAQQRLRPSTIANLKTHTNHHWKPLHDRPLVSIARADVSSRLREIEVENGPHAATRARRCLSTIYGWAIAEGLCETSPVTGTRAPADEVRRERVLFDAELAILWRALGEDDFGRILKLLILTGARRDEVAGMAWGELLTGADAWLIPPGRTKNGRPHSVPLPPAALAILGPPGDNGRSLVFGTGRGGFSGFSKRKAALDRQLDFSEPWRLHDLRRTAATGLAGLGVLPHVIEATLNHVSGFRAGVAGVYNKQAYEPEKRAALDLWSAHVLALAGGKPPIEA